MNNVLQLRVALVCFATVGVAACGDSSVEQVSPGEAIAAVCESPRLAAGEAAATSNRLASTVAASRWVAANVTNEEVRSWFSSLASLPPDAKAKQVREAASRAGLGRCLLAETWTRRQ